MQIIHMWAIIYKVIPKYNIYRRRVLNINCKKNIYEISIKWLSNQNVKKKL